MNNYESIDVEFKSEINEKNWQGWCKTIVAFSNTKGGKLSFGYNDNGTIVGIDLSLLDQKIRHVEQIIRSHVEPFPIYKIESHVLNNIGTFDVIVVSRNTSITWLLINDNPIMYVRREKMSVPATIEEMQNALLRVQTFDHDKTNVGIPCSLNCFSKLNYFYKQANNGLSLTDNDLMSLNLCNNEMQLTLNGILFVDDSNYRNANAVCNTWPETSKGTNQVLNSKQFRGSILDIFENIMAYIKTVSYYNFGGVKNGLFFNDDGSFSTVSLREALINALAHRDYKINGSEVIIDCYPDRIEITSPGSISFYNESSNNVSLEILPSLRRNPNICRVLVRCRLMEERGSGFAKILDDYKKMSDIFKPTCSFNQKSFTISLKNKKYQYSISDVNDTLTTNPTNYLIKKTMFKTRNELFLEKPKLQALEELIKQNPRISYEQIQNEFDFSRDGAKYYIKLLKEACLIRRVGNNLSGYYEIVNEVDRPSQFLNLGSDVQATVLKWCKEYFIKTKSFNEKHTSYGLKHILQHQNGTYLTNGQFKGAMILSGFDTKNINDLNWVFNISEQSAALKLKVD